MASERRIQELTARMGREAAATREKLGKLEATQNDLQKLVGQPPANGPRAAKGRTGASSTGAGHTGDT